MNIRYRRHLVNGKTVLPTDSKVHSIALRFIPSRKLAHHLWVRPFIVFSLPSLTLI